MKISRSIQILLITLFILNTVDVFSQVPVGLKYDINGEPFNGYYDPLTYSPKNKLSINLKTGLFERGSYYDKSNNKIGGYIRFENDRIWFKQTLSDLKRIIMPEEINSFVLGVDSFFVITDFYFKRKLKSKPEFVQFLSRINEVTFVKHYHFSSAAGQQYGGRPAIIESVLARNKKDSVWDNFFKDKFEINVAKYLDVPEEITRKIDSGKLTESSISSIVKIAEYFKKYNAKDTIYFDAYWQEISAQKLAKYSAVITEKKGSHWTLNYFNKEVRIYTITYGSFSPNIKVGSFFSYYSNGEKRQEIIYVDNKPIEFKTYTKKGALQTQYKYEQTVDKITDITKVYHDYIFAGDSIGNNLLDSSKITHQVVSDESSEVTYHRSFFMDRIIGAYWDLNGKKIHQVTNPNFDLKIKPLIRKLNYFLSDVKFNGALAENAQGIVLVAVIVNEKGFVFKSTILNKLHPELDVIVNDFVKEYLSPGGDESHRFKPLRKDGVKESFEFVIPIAFGINKFYRAPIYYNHFFNMNMHMMHNMNHMNNIVLPPTPRFPVGF
jgi:hypothetical protein